MILLTGGGSAPGPGGSAPGGAVPGGDPPGRLLLRAVRILLECILVSFNFCVFLKALWDWSCTLAVVGPEMYSLYLCHT